MDVWKVGFIQTNSINHLSFFWIFGHGDLAQPTDSKTYPVWLTHLSPIESVLGFGPWFVICYSETINFQNWVHHTDKSTTMVDPRGVYVGEFYQIVVHAYEEFCWALILLWCTHVKVINECQACIFQSIHVGGVLFSSGLFYFWLSLYQFWKETMHASNSSKLHTCCRA